MTEKIAIIGFGNIAKAIITPLLDKKLISPKNVYCLVNSEKSLKNIKENYTHNINVYKSSSKESKIIWDCQVKLLSVKPQHLKDIIEPENMEIKDNLLVFVSTFVSPINDDSPLPKPFLILSIKLRSQLLTLDS